MAIDYSLLLINRFRQELRSAPSTKHAVARTLATAGRTILVSGLLVILSLASLLIFPEVFLKSMALGGMAAILVAMISALTVLPAILAMLGPRINALRVRNPWRRTCRDGTLAGGRSEDRRVGSPGAERHATASALCAGGGRSSSPCWRHRCCTCGSAASTSGCSRPATRPGP